MFCWGFVKRQAWLLRDRADGSLCPLMPECLRLLEPDAGVSENSIAGNVRLFKRSLRNELRQARLAPWVSAMARKTSGDRSKPERKAVRSSGSK
jgi:hypothetical protein